MTDSTTSAANGKSSPRSWRDGIESLVVAVLMALVIKQFALEAFEVPTESMEPTIIGRADGGGYRVIANKTVYQVRDPRRWEVVIFQYPLNTLVNYVKRLVGMPEEWLFLRNGDVWTADGRLDRDAALAAAKIVRKPDPVQDALFDLRPVLPPQDRDMQAFRQYWHVGDRERGTGRVSVDADADEATFATPDGWTLVDFRLPDRYRVRGGLESPSLSDRRFDDFSPIAPARSWLGLFIGLPGPAHGQGPLPGHEAEMADLRLAVEVHCESSDGIAVLEIRDGSHGRPIRLEVGVEGGSESSRLLFGDETHPIDALIPTDEWIEIVLINVDDRIRVEIDGDEVLRLDYEHAPIAVEGAVLSGTQTSPPPALPKPRPSQPTHDLPHENGVSFGFARGTFRVRPPVLQRDNYYSYAGATDFHIPADNYLMLGDNSADSLDGRGWERADLRLRDENGGEVVLSGDFQAVGAEGRHEEGASDEARQIRPMKNPFDGERHFVDIYGNFRTIDPMRIVRVPDPEDPSRKAAVATYYDHFVPRRYIQGRAYVVFWPLLQIGLIR